MKELDSRMTSELIAERHTELLNKRELSIVQNRKDGSDEIYEVLNQPETQAVSKALDMAYKIKGAYKTGDTNIQVNIANLINKYGT